MSTGFNLPISFSQYAALRVLAPDLVASFEVEFGLLLLEHPQLASQCPKDEDARIRVLIPRLSVVNRALVARDFLLKAISWWEGERPLVKSADRLETIIVSFPLLRQMPEKRLRKMEAEARGILSAYHQQYEWPCFWGQMAVGVRQACEMLLSIDGTRNCYVNARMAMERLRGTECATTALREVLLPYLRSDLVFPQSCS